MLNFDIKRKINTLRDILVGKIPDPKAQVEQITIAMIYKFMDDMDLEGAEWGERQFFNEEYKKYAWSEIMNSENSGSDRAHLYAEGIEKMVNNPNLPQLFRDIFRGAYIPYRDPDTLNMFLKEISEFNYDNSEDLGNAFEYLLSIMGSQGDAGQFRTPRHIIDMIVEIVQPTKNESVLDPACGTAGFLISAYKHILEQNKDEEGHYTLTSDDRKRMTSNFAGYDISPDMVRLARVNMYLHKFAKPQISEYDTLTSEEKWDDSYDVILANPPFMTPKGGIKPHNRYRVQAKRAEVLFVDYIAEHLSTTGRAGIIVPEGIVFQSANAYKELRKYLVEDNLLYAVISLPSGVFNPYSGVKTSVLLFDRTFAKQKDEILFVKLENDGFDLGAQRREIKGSQIQDVINLVNDYKDGKDVSDNKLVTIATKEDIVKQDYILVGERYKVVEFVNGEYPLVELGEVCGINEKSIKLEDVSADKFIYLDIASVENESGKIDYTNYIELQNAPSRARRKVQNSDIILSTVRPNLKAYGYINCNCSDKCIASTGFTVLSQKKAVQKYIYYNLFSQKVQDQLISMMGKGAYPSVTQKDVSAIKIPLPPLSVQEEIVAEIEGYQKIIDGAKMIVDNYKPTIKIDPSWDMVKLGDVSFVQAGGTPLKSKTEFWNSPDYPWYTSGELNEVYTTDPQNLISEQGLNASSARLFPKGSLLIGMYDTAAFKMSILDRDGAFNQAICGVKPSDQINNIFLLLYFSANREKYLNMRVGARQRNLTKQFISDLIVPCPTLEIQNRIVEKINEEMAIVEQNKRLIEIFEQKIKDKISEVWGE